jgi:outer membrane protein OmpA-like peptidoglycan-associated protein
LQTARAKAVADLLIKQGINPKQVKFGTGTVSNDKKKGLSTDAVIKRKGG